MKQYIYLDACILIYLIEKHAVFRPKILERMEQSPGCQLAVSPLLRLEVLTKPLRDQDTTLYQDFEDFIAAQTMLPITDAIYDEALQLRARFRLKTPDALHLATAQHYGCTEFWTNDDRLNDAAGALAVNLLV